MQSTDSKRVKNRKPVVDTRKTVEISEESSRLRFSINRRVKAKTVVVICRLRNSETNESYTVI